MFKKAGICLFLLAAGVLCALDRGGVTFDWNILCGKSTPHALPGKTILKSTFDSSEPELKFRRELNVWSASGWVWAQGTKDKAHREAVGKLLTSAKSSSGPQGMACAELFSKPEINALLSESGLPRFINTLHRNITLLGTTPIRMRLTFQMQGVLTGKRGENRMELAIGFFDNLKWNDTKGITRRRIRNILALTPEWKKHTLEFSVPQGTKRLDLQYILYGSGRCRIADVEMQELSDAADAYEIAVVPMGRMDKRFFINEKSAVPLRFGLKQLSGTKAKKLLVQCVLPPGFEAPAVSAPARMIERKKLPDGSELCTLDFTSLIPQIGGSIFSPEWRTPSILLQTTAKAGTHCTMRFYAIADGKKGAEESIELVVSPALPKIPQPKLFQSGVCLTWEFSFPQGTAKKLAEFYADAGFSMIQGGINSMAPDFRAFLKARGIKLYASNSSCQNGYKLGAAPKPDEESFKLVDGKPFIHGGDRSLCPSAAYLRGNYYRNHVIPLLRSILVDGKFDNLMSNWETDRYDRKGCFCDRCKEEFRRFAPEIPAKELESAWPKAILSKYLDKWTKFRSYQHARIVQTIAEDVRKMGEEQQRRTQFIPELDCSSFNETAIRRGWSCEALVKDYIWYLDYLNVWGPYIYQDLESEAGYFPGNALVSWYSGNSGRKTAQKWQEKAPKMIAFPHAMQGSRITQPEALAFETLSYFVNGWHGSSAYLFPRGYDCRYWNKLAQANGTIARYEEIVLKGKEATEMFKLTPVSGTPVPMTDPALLIRDYLPKGEKPNILQLKGFRKEGVLLAAVGNFWEKAEVFSKLQVSGLDSQKKYQVRTEEDNLGVFSGHELAQGILIQTGALRWVFITIQENAAPVGKVLSQDELHRLMRESFPQIRKALELEKESREKRLKMENDFSGGNDYENFKKITGGKVTISASGKELLVQTPFYTAKLDPETGARLSSWKNAAGKELIVPMGKLGLALNGFWHPVSFFSRNGWKILSAAAAGEGVQVVLSRTLNPLESKEYHNLKLTAQYDFLPHSIKVQTQVENLRTSAVSFCFRYHNLPGAFREPGSFAEFSGGVRFFSRGVPHVFHLQEEEALLAKSFRFYLKNRIKSPDFILHSATGEKIAFRFPETKPQSIVFWSGGTYSTIEPVFPRTTLLTADKAQFSFEMVLK